MRAKQIENFARFLEDKLPARPTEKSVLAMMGNDRLSDAVFVSTVRLVYFLEDLKERTGKVRMPRWVDPLHRQAGKLFAAFKACEDDATAATGRAMAKEVVAYRALFRQ